MNQLQYLLQVTFCLACFYGFYHLTLRRETLFGTNRVYLITTLLVSLILPVIKIYIERQSTTESIILAPYEVVSPYVEALSSDIAIPTRSIWSWNYILLVVYTVGVALMSIRLCKAIFEIRRIRRYGIVRNLGGRKCILSTHVESPFSFLNTIYLPLQHNFQSGELKEIIVHEWAHIQNNHTIDILVIELACIGLWPSPFIYFYRKALKDVHEFEADAAVLKDTHWEVYANLLLNQQQSHLQNILSNQLMYSQLKKRLSMMNQKRSGAMAGLKYLGFIPVVLIALVLFSFREKNVGKYTFGTPADAVTDASSWMDALAIRDYLKQSMPQPLRGEAAQFTEKDREHPVFPGCTTEDIEEQEACSTKALMQYVQDHMVYPDALKSAGLEGMVIVKFTVGSDGWIKDLSVARSLHPEADQVVLDIVGQMNKELGQWLPATKESKGQNAEMYLPVKFALTTPAPEETVLQYAEEMPRFPGCEEITDGKERSLCYTNKLYEFIYSTIRYPEADKLNKVEGTCIVQFTIGVDGSISDIKVLRAPSESMRAEVMRMMKVMSDLPDRWIPGRNAGKPVAVRFTLPVKFVLQIEEHSAKPETTETEIQPKDIGNVRISPNPASGTIKVEVPENTEAIHIFNVAGQQVLSLKVGDLERHEETINTGSFPSGNYVVQITGLAGTITGSFSIAR